MLIDKNLVLTKIDDNDIDANGRCIIPYGVTEIGCCAFEGQKNLKSVILPSSIKHIRDWAFLRCESLEAIKTPSSVTSIDDDAFVGCSSLHSIIISDTAYIDEATLHNCPEDLKIIRISSLKNKEKNAFDEIVNGKYTNDERLAYDEPGEER